MKLLKLLIKLALFGLIANGAYQVGSAYWTHYNFRDEVQEMATFRKDKDDAFTRSGGRCECTRGSRLVIPASWRAPPGAGVNAATGTSARSGTWWDHRRKRASNGRIPRGADHGART